MHMFLICIRTKQTRTHTNTHIHKYTNVHIYNTHTHTHSKTHTRIHTHARTHTHGRRVEDGSSNSHTLSLQGAGYGGEVHIPGSYLVDGRNAGARGLMR